MNTKNNKNNHSPLLSVGLNMIPQDLKRIHLMGVCGTGMASLAGLLKQKGFIVTGSDENIYPPMSNLLKELDIFVMKGYSPQNLSQRPDLVIVGNVITRQNPEAIELSRRNIPYLSLPQALARFAMQGKKSIVISGTHGKTTTSTMAAWILEKAGMDPGFMIGGIPQNFHKGFNIGKGDYFVIEGDEYDTAFFDKGPKFLHYNPFITILTSIEFDHADIYRDLDHIKASFQKLVELIPGDGLLIANYDDPLVMAQAEKAECRVVTYGLTDGADWKATDIVMKENMTSFKVKTIDKDYLSILTSVYGEHNISNLLSTIALSSFIDIAPESLYSAIKDFKGVKRRQELRGERNGIMILDDFAHHPTAVEKTINAVKKRYRDRRLIAVFEPRSNSSRRNVFQEKYSLSFDNADLIFIPEPVMMEKIPPDERFSSYRLVEELKSKGLNAFYAPDTDNLLEDIIKHAGKGDVILVMSNGSFDNLHERLLERL
jgi:UDP-N-acetylmuramate: L-alanyl-gamma-D-glutamyl-meso-diaminopimelate ligase